MLFKADRQSRNNTSAKCLSEFGYSAQSPGNCLLILKENKNKKAEEATERAKLNEIKQEKDANVITSALIITSEFCQRQIA